MVLFGTIPHRTRWHQFFRPGLVWRTFPLPEMIGGLTRAEPVPALLPVVQVAARLLSRTAGGHLTSASPVRTYIILETNQSNARITLRPPAPPPPPEGGNRKCPSLGQLMSGHGIILSQKMASPS
jgi:hypothetical protein